VYKNPEFAEYAPFEIFYPKRLEMPKINVVTDADEAVTGTGIAGATVYIVGEGIPEDTQSMVGTDKTWSIAIPKLESGTVITAWQEFEERKSAEITTVVRIGEAAA
jgi:hypothetical protein